MLRHHPQIEKAHLSELDWALANLKSGDGKQSRKLKVGEKTEALFEAEKKASKDEVGSLYIDPFTASMTPLRSV